MYKVELTHIIKDLEKLPSNVVSKLQKWAEQVELYGLPEIRRIPGLHDEPLKGQRQGQRSIRLSRSYRAIYVESPKNKLITVIVIEVNKHEY